MTAEQRLEVLEKLIRQQQEEIKDLRNELRQQKAIGNATQQQAERAEEQAKGVEKKQASFSLPDWVSKFTLFGDIRFRHEGFYNQPEKDGDVVTARNRERIRWRLGMKYTYSDEVSGTFRLTSGNPNDPISTNDTLTGDFNRKHVNLDWAFMTVTPGQSFGIRPGLVSVTAGKFPNPMFKPDEMVFDEDLAPEGFSETFQLLAEPCGALDQLRVYVQQWTFDEISNDQDGWMIGGQVAPVFKLGDVVLEGGVGQYWWLNSDLIAQDLASNSALKNTNLLSTVPGEDGPVVDGYQSAFNQTNVALQATFPDAVCGKPVKVFTDYVYNWGAATDDAHGVTTGMKLGQTKEQGDWAATAMYEYLGQEAAISAFTFSDFGTGGTGVQGPILSLEYQLLKPLSLKATGYFTNFTDAPAHTTNKTQTRLQLDAQLRF